MLKYYAKYCPKYLENLLNTGWILLTFIPAMKNGWKLVKFCPKLSQKFTVFTKSFLSPSLSVLTQFCFVSLMNKICRFNCNLQIPISQEWPSVWLNGARLPPKYIFKNYGVTRWLEKNGQIFQRVAQKVAKSKKAKISTTKLNFKTQNIYIKPFSKP